MIIEQINIGLYPNDGTGDDLRVAFEKIISNFSSIESTVVLSASNIGDGAAIVYEDAAGNSLNFRTITSANANMEVSVSDDNVILNVLDRRLQDIGDVAVTQPINGEALVYNNAMWAPAKIVNKIVAGNNVTIFPETGTGDVIVNAQVDASEFSTVDFGTLGTARNTFELLLQSTLVTFGSFRDPSNVSYDAGTISGLPVDATPVYALFASRAIVTEGESFSITLITNNIVDGTEVPYTITGVLSSDINGLPLTGVFTVNNGTSQIIIDAIQDGIIDGSKTLSISIDDSVPFIRTTVGVLDEDQLVPLVLEGGEPLTITFDASYNGGEIDTNLFNDVFDGGIVFSNLDGGMPETTAFDDAKNGGTPSGITIEIYDGGGV